MRRLAVVIGGVLAVAVGVWVWQSAITGQGCETWQSSTLDGGTGKYATVEEALAGFGEFPGIKGHLPPESLVPSDEESPQFGATVNPEFHTDTAGGLVYDIWKDGVVVQRVTLDNYSGSWGISGYSGCAPIP